jgi:hypothetical protein
MKTLLLLFVSFLLTSCSDTHLSSTSWLASAAIAAVVSALVSGLISIYVKDKEYKNDFYKKVIDKRLKAIELLEPLSSSFVAIYKSKKTGKSYHAYFADYGDSDLGINSIIDDASKYAIWLSKSTYSAFGNLIVTVLDIKKRSRAVTDSEGKLEIAAEGHASIEDARKKLETSIKADMNTMHNIKRFLKE